MANYSIQNLSKAYGTTARTIRYYEDKGIISPSRQGVTRIFSERDKVRLELALRGRRLGFSLEEIREIIDMYDPEQPGDPQQLIFLCQKIREHRGMLLNKFNDISETLNVMNDIERKALASLKSQLSKDASSSHALN